MGQPASALTGMGSQRRSDSGGRREKTEHTRCERLAVTVYPQDMRDLDALSMHWDVPISTLVWAVVHDWLQRSREASTVLGDARGPLKMVIELAMRDRELGPWLRGQIAEGER